MQYFLSKEKKEIILNMYYVSNCESEGAFTQATIGAVKGQDISHHLAKEQEEDQGTVEAVKNSKFLPRWVQVGKGVRLCQETALVQTTKFLPPKWERVGFPPLLSNQVNKISRIKLAIKESFKGI